MDTIRIRQKIRNGRRWEFREFYIPTDAEIKQIASRLHTIRKLHKELLGEWQVEYTPSKPHYYQVFRFDPLNLSDMTVTKDNSMIRSRFQIRRGGWIKPDWAVNLVWNQGDDAEPSWYRVEKNLLPLLNVQQPSHFPETEIVNPIPLSSTPSLFEGAVFQIEATEYERNPIARQQCIEFHGASCIACGFDFGSAYGTVATGFIHVHHLKPISDIGRTYLVDPVTDLVPLCPNCHALAHLRTPPYGIEEIKSFLQTAGRQSLSPGRSETGT